MGTTADKLAKLANTKSLLKTAINGTGSVVGDVFSDYPSAITNGKATIAAAITDKGVQTAADATFQTMAENVGKIESGGASLIGLQETTFMDMIIASLTDNNSLFIYSKELSYLFSFTTQAGWFEYTLYITRNGERYTIDCFYVQNEELSLSSSDGNITINFTDGYYFYDGYGIFSEDKMMFYKPVVS